MSIVILKIKNFLSIADADIDPKGKQVVQIVGRNNEGKTSILKAIRFAIKGSAEDSLVKFDQDAAIVDVEIDDSTLIKRRINSDGRQSLDVSKDGFKAKAPQSLLDTLFDQSSFNPLELLNPKARTDAILNSIDLKIDESKLKSEVLSELPPLDYTQHGLKVIDQCHRYFYQRRAEANKDTADKKNRFETYKADYKEPTPPFANREDIQKMIARIQDKIKATESSIQAIERRHEDAKKATDRLNKYCAELEKIDFEIESLTRAYETNLKALKARKDQGEKFTAQAKEEVPGVLESPEPHKVALQELKIELQKTETMTAEVDAYEAVLKQKDMITGMEVEYKKASEFAEDLNKKVEALGGPIKQKLMAEVEMPVPGLEYRNGEFLVDNVPVDNLSSSKAIRLALGIARKHAKKVKIICIDGAEALDEETFKAFSEEIKGDGFTYFLTKVGEPFDIPDSTKIRMDGGVATEIQP